jgi:hypothetical protein
LDRTRIIIDKLLNYIESEDFKGYDPYDFLKSMIPFKWFGKYGMALAIQAGKRLPLNIRPLIGVKKGINPKAMGLIIRACSMLFIITGDETYKKKADFVFDWLMENDTKGYRGLCWGYDFDWANPGKVVPAYHPSIVVTSFVAKGIYEYYMVFKKPEAFDALNRCGDFILKDIPLTTTEYGTCFSYTNLKMDCCYNASLLGAEILAKVFTLGRNPDFAESATKATDFVIHHQHPDGHWNYSIDLETGKERRQIDFHQGFILESLYEVINHLELKDKKYQDALRSGAEFYMREQFFTEGRSKWRLPQVYPVDIHNQSQGIITFSILKELDICYLDFAKKITGWTIKNMQHRKGYFYFRKSRFFTNRISYLRWNQAWMLVALTELYKKEAGL